MKPIHHFHKSVLPNGLTVISEHVATVRSISIGVWIKHGSRSEKATEKGLAHFIEHLVFKGTKNRSSFEIANSLERLGGSLNAYTSKEATVFYAHILDEHLTEAVDVLSDIVSRTAFDPEEIEKERDVVIEEINSTYDIPDEICHDAFLEALFPDHPLGWPILGNKKSIKSFSKDEIVEFWRNRFSPENVMIVASGNLMHEDLLALTEKYFDLPEANEQILWPPITKEANLGNKIYTKTSQAHVCLGARCYPYSSDNKFPFAALSTYLGGGMSSALFQKIREQNGLAYSVYTFLDFYKDTGNFGVYLATDNSKKTKALDLVYSEFEAVLKNGIPENDLVDIRSQLKGEFLLGLESTQHRMSRLAKMEIYLELEETIEDIIMKIESISHESTGKVAAEILAGDLSQIEVLPEKTR